MARDMTRDMERVLDAFVTLRRLQKRYVKTGDKDVLTEVRRAEHSADVLLDEMRPRGFGGHRTVTTDRETGDDNANE